MRADPTFMFLAIVICILGLMVVTVDGDAADTVRREAVEQGHAEWVVVDEDGTTEFRWKKCGVCSPVKKAAKGGEE